MRSIILAAGEGKRLRSVTDDPKCMLEIGNETLIKRQLRLLEQVHSNPVIVCGYKHDVLVRHIGFKDFKVNPVWKQSNTLISLLFGMSYWNTDCLVLNGDTIFQEDLLQRIMSADYSAAAVQDVDPTEEEVKIVCDSSGRVASIGKHLTGSRLEAVGVYLFRKPLLNAIRETTQTLANPWELYYEDALNECLANHPMQAIKTSMAVEIDTPDDYEKAKVIYGRGKEVW